MRYTRDNEVEKQFKENPELIKRPLVEIAKFFLIQGELRASHLIQMSSHKCSLYRQRLKELDEAALKEVEREVKQVLGDD